MSGSPDVLLVAAFQPELAPIRPHLGGGLDGFVGPMRVAARVVGIGLPMAAAGVALHAGKLQPRAVVAVGTCGAYSGSGLAIGDVIVARRVHLVDPSALEGRAEFPAPMRVVCDSDGALAEGIVGATGIRRADVATTVAVTVDGATAVRIAGATGTHVEHLEAHGMAMACAALGMPFGAVLAVANSVGSSGRSEWRAHHVEASMRAVDVVVGWLRRSG
ncbi:MAG: hypothetical protein WBY94_12515 [Polyangiaceae bacterium]